MSPPTMVSFNRANRLGNETEHSRRIQQSSITMSASSTMCASQPPAEVKWIKTTARRLGRFDITLPGVIYLQDDGGEVTARPLTSEAWKGMVARVSKVLDDMTADAWTNAKKNPQGRAVLKNLVATALSDSLKANHSTIAVPTENQGWTPDQIPSTGHDYIVTASDADDFRAYTITVNNAHAEDWSINLYGAVFDPQNDRVNVDTSPHFFSDALGQQMPIESVNENDCIKTLIERVALAHLASYDDDEDYMVYLSRLGERMKPLMEKTAQFRGQYQIDQVDAYNLPDEALADPSEGKSLQVVLTQHDFDNFAIDDKKNARAADLRWMMEGAESTLQPVFGKGKKKDQLTALEWTTPGGFVDRDGNAYRLTLEGKQNLLDRVVHEYNWSTQHSASWIDQRQTEEELDKMRSHLETVKRRWLPLGLKPQFLEACPQGSSTGSKATTISSKSIEVFAEGVGLRAPSVHMKLR